MKLYSLEDYKNQPHNILLRIWKEYVKLCLPVKSKPAQVYKFPDVTPNKLKELKI